MAPKPLAASGMQPQPYNREAEELRREILDNVPYAEDWISSPNTRLRGRSPEEAIAAGDVEPVRRIVHSILRNITGAWYREVPLRALRRAILTDHTTQDPTRFSAGSPHRPSFEILYLCENDIQLPYETRRTYGSMKNPASIISVPQRDAFIRITATVDVSSIADLTDPEQADVILTNAQELTGDWEAYPDRTSPPGCKSMTHCGLAPTQLLGHELFANGFTGFITFCAPLAYFKNLVIFPQRLVGTPSYITYTWIDAHGPECLKIP